MIFDEYGRPFIILREQQAQARIRGKEAQKVRKIDRKRKKKLAVSQPAQPTAQRLRPPLELPCKPFDNAQRSLAMLGTRGSVRCAPGSVS